MKLIALKIYFYQLKGIQNVWFVSIFALLNEEDIWALQYIAHNYL